MKSVVRNALNLSKCLFILFFLVACSEQIDNSVVGESTMPSVPNTLTPTIFPEPSPAVTTTQSSENGESTIYAYFEPYGGGFVELWQINKPSSKIIYRNGPLHVTDPLVPNSIKNELDNTIAHIQQFEDFTIDKDEITFDAGLSDIALSHSKEKMVLVEIYSWYQYPRSMFGPVTFQRLLILDLASGSIQTGFLETDDIYVLSWLPDDQSITYSVVTDAYARVSENREYDLSTGTSTLLDIHQGTILSSDDERATIVRPMYEAPYIVISYPTNPGHELIVRYPWEKLENLTWVPGRDLLTAVGKIDDGSLTQEIYLIDITNPDEPEITIFPAQTSLQYFSEPRWSFDGSFLAVNAVNSWGDYPPNLLVFDFDGNLISELDVKRQSDRIWDWADDQNKILMLLGFRTDIRQDIGIYDPVTGMLEIVDLPSELKIRLENDTIYLGFVTW